MSRVKGLIGIYGGNFRGYSSKQRLGLRGGFSFLVAEWLSFELFGTLLYTYIYVYV